MSRRDPNKLTLLLALYASQAIPLGFFITAMPVILRKSGLSLENVGLFSAIAFPWLIKFAWAPAIDRWSPPSGSRRGRHYLGWILPLQGAAIAAVVTLAFLDLGAQMPLVVAVSALFMLLAATQDIASDGLAVHVLASGERGFGNGLQVGGYYLGQILGGGVILMVFGRFGWTFALLAMATFLALPLVPASRFPEGRSGGPPAPGAHRRSVTFGSLGRFFKRPGIAGWVLVVVLLRTGEAMATYVFNQMMVDLGVGVATIGWISGGVYAVGALLGALSGGLLVEGLRRRTALTAFTTAQALALGGYALAVQGSVTALGTAAFLVAFTGGMATTALYATMMDASLPPAAATDFTLQQSLCAFGPVLGITLSGFSAAALGFEGHFFLCGLLGLGTVLLLLRVRLPEPPGRSLAVEAEA